MIMGFDVRVGKAEINTNMSMFARLVNSIDMMVGMHRTRLTNMVFLPSGAMLIKVMPYVRL
jgi:hypothetical protein